MPQQQDKMMNIRQTSMSANITDSMIFLVVNIPSFLVVLVVAAGFVVVFAFVFTTAVVAGLAGAVVVFFAG